jgi:hypothetical protein
MKYRAAFAQFREIENNSTEEEDYVRTNPCFCCRGCACRNLHLYGQPAPSHGRALERIEPGEARREDCDTGALRHDSFRCALGEGATPLLFWLCKLFCCQSDVSNGQKGIAQTPARSAPQD